MPTQVGDVVHDPLGPPRVVLEVWNADDYIAMVSASAPIGTPRGSSAERCALFGSAKRLTPSEARCR